MEHSPFEEFNRQIAQLDIPALPGPTPKALFLCGTPRSGTTVLSQALAFCGDVGYIDNLIARFASNPRLGVLLSKALNLPKQFTGNSNFGRTEGLTEPHEFGLGWSRLLDQDSLEQPGSETRLGDAAISRLEDLIRSFGKPAVFKSFIYLWHIEEIATALPTSVWLHIERDLPEAARSLEKLYRARAKEGTPPQWTSAVMKTTKETSTGAPLAERCLRQVTDIDEHIRSQLAPLPLNRRFTVSIDEYKSDAATTIDRILEHFDIPRHPDTLEKLG